MRRNKSFVMISINLAAIIFYILAGGGGMRIYSDVTADVSPKRVGLATITLKNNTLQFWQNGGARFTPNGAKWTRTDPASGITIDSAQKPLIDVYFNRNALAWQRALRAGDSIEIEHLEISWQDDKSTWLAKPGTEVELLLKTGAPGIPDEPQEYDPITIDELKELINKNDFYNPSYRYSYYDSLGVNGGKYSGGLMDTYIGQTQIHFAIPKGNFSQKISNTDIRAERGDNAKEYYMALAMGQEYLRLDAQSMFAISVKETFSGTNITPWATDATAVSSGNYTNWHVEDPTMVDRALAYSQFFPKYEARLAAARDVTSSRINTKEFADYYVGAYNGRTSPRTINGIFVAALVLYVNYDIMAYSTDICWKYALGNAKDPYFGISAMIPMYNIGQWGQIGNVKAIVNDDNAVNDPNARNRFPMGNNNYRTDALTVAQDLINASKDFEKGNGANSEIIDFEITLDQLRAMFFGANGTVSKQGEGGILLFYYDPTVPGKDYTAIRQKIWDNLTQAFDLLKGKSPTSKANTISYRYDFLSAIRTVKADLPYERRFQINGDASTLVSQNSLGNCSKESGTVDEKYPYATAQVFPDEEICEVDVSMTDETLCGKVKWSIDYSWTIWNTAAMIENAPGKRNTFKIEIPREMAEAFADRNDGSGKFVWIMAEDAAGNSVVIKREISFKKQFKKPQMQWAAVYDTDGDGYPDSLKAQITRNDLDGLKKAKYSWSWGEIQNQGIADDSINADRDTLFVTGLQSKNGAGGGWLYMEYDSLKDDGNASGKKVKDSVQIIDSCGPALLKMGQNPTSARDGDAHFYPTYDRGNPNEYDTLIVYFTETVKEVLLTNGTQLKFKDKEDKDITKPGKAVKVEDMGGGKWRFLYDPKNNNIADADGKITSDFVNIIHTGGDCITDGVGNLPLSNNQWVRIIDYTKPAAVPNFKFAYMYDNWGSQNGRLDGRGDSLVVTLELKEHEDAYTTQDIFDVEVTFAGQTSQGSITPINNSTFYYIDRTFTAGSGSGNIKINFASGDVLEGSITEKIAPVLVWASYERYDGKDDTLRVKFSEKISNGGIDSPILANSGSHNFELKPASVSDSAAIYFLKNGNLVNGDSVWLAASKEVKDLQGIEQTNENNQKVKIEYFRHINMSVKSAAYFDTSEPRDGYIDLIKANFAFGDGLDPKYVNDVKHIVAQGLTLPDYRKFNAPAADDISVPQQDLFEIRVSQDKAKFANVKENDVGDIIKAAKTDTDDRDVLKIKSVYYPKDSDTLAISIDASITINDSIAPIINSGGYLPDLSETDYLVDTLIIHFSENISCDAAKEAIKALKKSNGEEYDFDFNSINITNNRSVKVQVRINDSSVLPANGDSIRIEGGRGIEDTKKNSQELNTVWAPLEVGKYGNGIYGVIIYPNPYDPEGVFSVVGGEKKTNPVIEKYGNSGESKNMAVVVKSIGSRASTQQHLSGDITIIDGLGNVLVEKEEFSQGKEGVLIWTWNGKNLQRRTVGAGTYQALIQITNETENTTDILLRKIGIKK